jgi:DNA-binding NarL/FixJ family response regulator
MEPACSPRHDLHKVSPVRILIVEDHLMFREVLRKVCAVDLGHEVVGEAGDGRMAVALALTTSPDLVLLDLHLPNLDGFGVLDALRRLAPDVRVLLLSSHCDQYTVYRAAQARVQGFVDKNTNTVAVLKDAITAVSKGRVFFSDAFKQVKTARHQDPQSFDKLLTPRERAILPLLGEPLDDAEIANRFGFSIGTAEKHRFNIRRKLGLQSAAELARYAREHGFTLHKSQGGDGAMLP